MKQLKHDMNDTEARLQPHSAIEQVWEIVVGPDSGEFPFAVLCTLASGKQIIYPCMSLPEAEGKINAVAEVMYGKQPLATA